MIDCIEYLQGEIHLVSSQLQQELHHLNPPVESSPVQDRLLTAPEPLGHDTSILLMQLYQAPGTECSYMVVSLIILKPEVINLAERKFEHL